MLVIDRPLGSGRAQPTPLSDAPLRPVAAPDGATVVALIPAHDEAGCIGTALRSVAAQTVSPDRTVVVIDNCSDDTAAVARAHGVDVIETVDNRHKKAGALNHGLSEIIDDLGPADHVLIMDADSELSPGFVERALVCLERHPQAGAVCAAYRARPDRPGLLHRLQSNEYTRAARDTGRRRGRATVLSGVATLFPVAVLREVRRARDRGELPAGAGATSYYDVTVATEDIELTHALIQLGFRPMAPRECVVWTDTMTSWSALGHQRLRWQRGMLDSLRLYGWSRVTWPYIWRQFGLYAGSMALPVHAVALTLSLLLIGSVRYRAIWLMIVPLFVLERVLSVRRDGARAMVLAGLLVPELIYETFRSAIYWKAVLQWFRHTERVWVPT